MHNSSSHTYTDTQCPDFPAKSLRDLEHTENQVLNKNSAHPAALPGEYNVWVCYRSVCRLQSNPNKTHVCRMGNIKVDSILAAAVFPPKVVC